MATTTKKELVNRIAEKLEVKQHIVGKTIQVFLDDIVDTLAAGNRLEFREFGVFEVQTRKARMAQNPRTLEKVPIPDRKVVKFAPGRSMRTKVRGSGEGQQTTPPKEEPPKA
jgi:integration host factor subunit beta